MPDSVPASKHAGDNTHRADHSRLYMALLLVGLLIFTGINLAIFYKNLNDNLGILQRAADSGTKTELAFNMREAMQLRWLSLNTMLHMHNAFERDEELQRFHQHAQLFRTSRERLLKFELTQQERDLLKRISDLTLETQPVIDDLGNTIIENGTLIHSEQLVSQAKLMHGRLFNAIYDFIQLQHEFSNKANQDTVIAYKRSVTLLALLSMAGFLFAVLLVLFTRRYMLAQNRRLAISTQQRADFVAAICHEIRTPLTAIYGYSENLLQAPSMQDQEFKAVSGIRRNSLFLQNLINNTLDLSKLEAGKLAVEHVPLAITELLADIQAMLGRLAEEKGLYLRIQYLPPLPRTLYTDPVRLKQVLINLIQNAIKFTRTGGVRINVSCDVRAQMMYLDIVDTGIGMTREQQDRLFTPYTQGSLSTLREFGGTGLGLFLTRELMEYLHGKITIESAPGAGSRFTISLPTGALADEDLLTTIPDTLFTDNETQQTLNYRRFHGNILLAEDAIDNQLLFAMYIAQTSAILTTVDNGNDAVTAVGENNFDLILLDIEMPGMKGIEAATHIRHAGYNGPLIALTGHQIDLRENPEYKVFDEIISKPISQNQFLARLALYLPLRARQEALPATTNIDLSEARQTFLTLLPQRTQDLRHAEQEKNSQAILAGLHQIKGSAGALGFDDIFTQCTQLETTLRSHSEKPGELSASLQQLYTTLEAYQHKANTTRTA